MTITRLETESDSDANIYRLEVCCALRRPLPILLQLHLRSASSSWMSMLLSVSESGRGYPELLLDPLDAVVTLPVSVVARALFVAV